MFYLTTHSTHFSYGYMASDLVFNASLYINFLFKFVFQESLYIRSMNGIHYYCELAFDLFVIILRPLEECVYKINTKLLLCFGLYRERERE